MHRGQTYLTATDSQLRYFFIFFISRRDGENNGFLAGVPLLPPPSRVVSRPNSLPLPFRTPATQAIDIVAKLTLAAVISSKVLIAFTRFVVKSRRSVMALVVFLERLVVTKLEGPITNDHFLSCTSVSNRYAWCTKSFWEWTFLLFHIRQKCAKSRKLTFSLG